jgi:hypothetical protein
MVAPVLRPAIEKGDAARHNTTLPFTRAHPKNILENSAVDLIREYPSHPRSSVA